MKDLNSLTFEKDPDEDNNDKYHDDDDGLYEETGEELGEDFDDW